MRKGDTPKIIFTLPFTIDVLSAAYLTVQQSGTTKFEQDITALTLSGNTIEYTMTQAESLSLSENTKAYIQLTIKTTDGDRYTSSRYSIDVDSTMKGATI